MKKMTLAIILLAIPALVLAGPRKKMKHQPMMEKRMETCEQLNLTDEQQEKMHDLRVAHQKVMIPVQADLKLAHLELEELIRNGDTSKKLDAAIKKVNDLKANQFEKQIKHRLEVGKVLTNEQKAIWHKHHNGSGKGCGDRFGRMGDGTRMQCMPDGPKADRD